jgi:hypothetical protein
LDEGDNLILTCILTGPPDADIPGPVLYFTHNNFTIRLPLLSGRTYAKSNISVADGGEYKCQAGDAQDSVMVEVVAAQDSGNVAALASANVEWDLIALIIGISIALFSAFVAVIFFIQRRKRRYVVEVQGKCHFF